MAEAIDAEGESIDSLIQWLRSRRASDPDAPLTHLLAGRTLDPSRLVDVACIDLIQRRRMGHSVTTEHYLQEFPSLRRESTRLDLIDAELCVINELGGQCEASDFVERFPDLASPIRELMTLNVVAQPSWSRDIGDSPLDVGQSLAADPPPGASPNLLSLPTSGHRSDDLPGSSFPVAVPDWFVAAKPIAHDSGRWLIKGRDFKRGIPLAMKVIELPRGITRSQCDQALEACEAAARVANRNWTTPIVAAIAGQHLAVVRPWVHATPWTALPDKPSDREATIRRVSGIAFTLQAAHQVGATHGGVHRGNLLIDHGGRIQIVDAICSGKGFSRWLQEGAANESGDSQLQRRIAIDTRCLIELVVRHCRSTNGSPAVDIAELKRIAADHPREACGRIGDQLIRRSERPHDSDRPTGSPNGGLVAETARRLRELRRRLGGE